MKIGEILSLNPKHLDELRSYYAVCPFDDVELVAQERAFIDQDLGHCATIEFEKSVSEIVFLHPVGGDGRTHMVFADKNLEEHFLMSYVSDGDIEDCAIFHIVVH